MALAAIEGTLLTPRRDPESRVARSTRIQVGVTGSPVSTEDDGFLSRRLWDTLSADDSLSPPATEKLPSPPSPKDALATEAALAKLLPPPSTAVAGTPLRVASPRAPPGGSRLRASGTPNRAALRELRAVNGTRKKKRPTKTTDSAVAAAAAAIEVAVDRSRVFRF